MFNLNKTIVNVSKCKGTQHLLLMNGTHSQVEQGKDGQTNTHYDDEEEENGDPVQMGVKLRA